MTFDFAIVTQTIKEEDDMEAFSGSQADLEGAAEDLFSSPPYPQPLRFETLSLKTPKPVPPTPGTALQQKIETKLEKSLGTQFNIQFNNPITPNGGLLGVHNGSISVSQRQIPDYEKVCKRIGGGSDLRFGFKAWH